MTGRIDIHEDDFPNHVRQMHLERDKMFEMEFKVCIFCQIFVILWSLYSL